MGAFAGKSPAFKIIFCPLSPLIKEAKPVAKPARGSLQMVYTLLINAYCLVAKYAW
jgi:hypothetical protein